MTQSKQMSMNRRPIQQWIELESAFIQTLDRLDFKTAMQQLPTLIKSASPLTDGSTSIDSVLLSLHVIDRLGHIEGSGGSVQDGCALLEQWVRLGQSWIQTDKYGIGPLIYAQRALDNVGTRQKQKPSELLRYLIDQCAGHATDEQWEHMLYEPIKNGFNSTLLDLLVTCNVAPQDLSHLLSVASPYIQKRSGTISAFLTKTSGFLGRCDPLDILNAAIQNDNQPVLDGLVQHLQLDGAKIRLFVEQKHSALVLLDECAKADAAHCYEYLVQHVGLDPYEKIGGQTVYERTQSPKHPNCALRAKVLHEQHVLNQALQRASPAHPPKMGL